jgi:tetratricopeptide (TPR) repeat protein
MSGFYQANASDGSSSVSHVEPHENPNTQVTQSLINQLDDLNHTASSYLQRGYFTLARETVSKSVELAQKELGDRHFIYRRQKTSLYEYDWIGALNDEDKQKYFSAFSSGNEAILLRQNADYEKAVPILDKTLKVFQQLNSPPTNDYAWFHEEFARALRAAGRLKEALAHAEEARQMRMLTLGEPSNYGAVCLDLLVQIERDQGDYVAATRTGVKACKMWEDCGVGFEPGLVDSAISSMNTLNVLGEHQRMIEAFKATQTIANRIAVKNDSWECFKTYSEAVLLEEQGNTAEALKKVSSLVDRLVSATSDGNDEWTVGAKLYKANLLITLGKLDEAAPLIRSVYSGVSADKRVPLVSRIRALKAYGQLLIAQNEVAEATVVLQSAIQGLEKQLNPNHPDLRGLLELNSTALRELKCDDEAKKCEARLAEIQAKVDEMRRQIDADLECKFFWEK